MDLKAQKLSGLGNKIILIDLLTQSGTINSKEVKKITDTRQEDFDQLISIKPPNNPLNDLRVEIFNRDGSIAVNCVNGARCLAKYVSESGLIAKKNFLVETDDSIWKIGLHANGIYSVQLSPPNFEACLDTLPKANKNNRHKLILENGTLEVGTVNLGNQHAVAFFNSIRDIPLRSWGDELQNSSYFPRGVNLGIAKILSSKKINLRVYERGVGETMACGSGACAATVIGNKENLLADEVEVEFKQGSIFIEYDKKSGYLIAKGSADYLYELSLKTSE